ncbi:AAA family ATPase [Streptomyces sp. NBC_00996]|uniref:AAA family ATPase n=1 Tax=Streptomyces sp. NBC_00996 TaxID=2903710 RepID=UPI00386F9E95|nr:AAA family ATPase [Streptomyces sp. NBC_00996]
MTVASGSQTHVPDRDDGLVYVMPDSLELSVKVALAAGRPLLLRGKPGSGKSSMAPFVAKERGWRYYNFVVTSQTRARDLQWTYDGVRRLAEAQTPTRGLLGRGSKHLSPDYYVEPGPLWWAFAPKSAARHVRAMQHAREGIVEAYEHPLEKRNKGRDAQHAVVLIDEIDKADPDVPNGLLAPLASHGFTVAESGTRVEFEASGGEFQERPFHRNLVVITTNEERELPQAFLRRCVIAKLVPPTEVEELVRIAEEHLRARLGKVDEKDLELASALATELKNVRDGARQEGIREPSTAEYLDALWACRSLGFEVRKDDENWQAIRGLTLFKPQHLRD